MSVKVDPDGRRWLAAETEVPGTPEEMWQAIATGPGVSSWFMPTTIDGRPGGKVVHSFGPGMDSESAVGEWQPPHRFTATNPGWLPGSPPVATEWVVEARAGGTCVVRVVHSLFAATDDWDDQITGAEAGWPVFFHILKLRLTHFRGQQCATAVATATAAGPVAAAWDPLAAPFGLATARVGDRVAAGGGAPPLSGVVERARGGDHAGLLVRLDGPAPGVASLGAYAVGDQSMVCVYEYRFGDTATEVAADRQAVWQAWLTDRTPAG